MILPLPGRAGKGANEPSPAIPAPQTTEGDFIGKTLAPVTKIESGKVLDPVPVEEFAPVTEPV